MLKGKNGRLDTLTPEQRRRAMASVKSEDTVPEMRIRRLLFSLGYRYRLHRKDLPGKPDIVFPLRQKAIFIHGCFWHGHQCKHGSVLPKSNTGYWLPKLERNKRRDNQNRRKLQTLGWKVKVVWECQIRNQVRIERELLKFLESES